jgi:prolipoprotein diacylglyceryl transferase
VSGLAAALPASIPSPSQGVWHLGPIPIRAYALVILVGIVVAVWLGDRRWQQRGGEPGVVLDVSAWIVPFGIVGGRIYHVITSWQLYFGPGGDPWRAPLIWEGGLGIWGAVALGAVGGWIAMRRRGLRFAPMADALAPGVVLAQGIGRWGNWFNNELYGSPTTLPWGLQVHNWDQNLGHAVSVNGSALLAGLYHPTFLYESLWDVGVAVVLLVLDRRRKLGYGRVFALYVLLYTIGRFWIEALRIDDANLILGLRLNLWTSLIVGLGALVFLQGSVRRHPGRDTTLTTAAAIAEVDADVEPTADPDTEPSRDEDQDQDHGQVAEPDAEKVPAAQDHGTAGGATMSSDTTTS